VASPDMKQYQYYNVPHLYYHQKSTNFNWTNIQHYNRIY